MTFRTFLKKVKKKLFLNFRVKKIDKITKENNLKIMNTIETLDYIIANKCSIARFGDGELRMIFKNINISFQSYSNTLSEKLRETLLANENNNLLICIPFLLIDHNSLSNSFAKKVWKTFKHDYMMDIHNLLGKNYPYVFGDSFISRPYMDFQDYEKANLVFKKFKSIWNEQNIVIVEGSKTRLGIGNDLFDNAKSIKRILVPSKGAYDKIDSIKEAILKNTSQKDLILLAVGPTATILASDLSKQGLWSLDIGHIDIEYEWFLRKATKKINIHEKSVIEVPGGEHVDTCNNENYNRQIIFQIE